MKEHCPTQTVNKTSISNGTIRKFQIFTQQHFRQYSQFHDSVEDQYLERMTPAK